MNKSWLLYTLITGIPHLKRPLSYILPGVVMLQSVIIKSCIHILRRHPLVSLSLIILTSNLRQLEWHTREASDFSRSIWMDPTLILKRYGKSTPFMSLGIGLWRRPWRPWCRNLT